MLLQKIVPLIIVILYLLPSRASANVLFEGWFEVVVGSEKVGYMTERYEFTDNKFKATYYLKTNADGNNVTESLKALSKPDLTPISYSYTSTVGTTVKSIDAEFKADVMTLTSFDGTKKTKNSKRIKKGTFLSQFLLYLILQQKDGLKVGKSYTYSAIAEEDGEVYSGSAFVKSQEDVKGKQAFKILNKFKGEDFFTWISTHGEPLLVRSPDKNIDVRFAENQDEATKGMGVNLQALTLLFGTIPGTSGSLDNKADAATTDLSAPAPEETPAAKAKKKKKKKTTPLPGDGVEIKGVPPPKSSDSPSQTQ